MRGDGRTASSQFPACMYGPPPLQYAAPCQPRYDARQGTPTGQREAWAAMPARTSGMGTILRANTSARKHKRSTYKHVPHREKPVHLVQRRNARERRRVQAVNSAFVRLRRHIPHENKNKRLSKVKTLRTAIDYINEMHRLIQDHDRRQAAMTQHRGSRDRLGDCAVRAACTEEIRHQTASERLRHVMCVRQAAFPDVVPTALDGSDVIQDGVPHWAEFNYVSTGICLITGGIFCFGVYFNTFTCFACINSNAFFIAKHTVVIKIG